MSANSRRHDFSAPTAPATGDFKDVKTRSVQRMGGSSNCLGVNLTDVGTTILGIDVTDDVDLVIYEQGIWIPKNE